jgi:hypothetical protein
MRHLKILGIILMACFTCAIISCDLLQESQPSAGTGNVVINITDAPFPADFIDEVQVTIDKVELRIAGGTCTSTSGESVGDKYNNGKHKGHDFSSFNCDSGFVVVSEKTSTIDLLQLQNGIMAVLADAEIPVGKYDMIRLHIVDAVVVIDENTSFPLKVPSGNASGLKIMLDNELTVTENETSEILIDFDLSRSFITMGNLKSKKGITGFIFKPVIRAINNKHTSTIYGKVYEGESTAVAGAQITVIQADTVVTTALTNSKGYYKVMGLHAGKYSMKVEKEGYTTVAVTDINLNPKSSIKKDFKLVKP